ncbi:MAG: beta-ketoacyl synthase N-terminal-like domain-containing protein [Planctomycetota bacterium]
MPFSPIAIVGQGCVLPGALSVDEYWDLLYHGRTAIRSADRGSWSLDHRRIVAQPGQDLVNRAVTDHGGYVGGFAEKFDPTGFQFTEQEVLALDTNVQWLLESSRQALAECARTGIAANRQAMIVGNLGYPTALQSRLCESIWLGNNGFSTKGFRGVGQAFHGNLAELAGRGLGFQGVSYAIDAACASSLYAIHLACQALHDDRADLILAGGTNNSDDLFLHIGFSTLKALSPTGFSRPFSLQADGLIPAHGAAVVALKRLNDAIRDGDKILGVIRGVGVSNDGRAGGFLSPAQSGQAQAIRMAFESAELNPADVQVVECHATGTSVGDGVELAALNEVFAGAGPLRIGSHKGNIGHAITAAGAAGLLKVLGMFRHQTFVPTVPGQNWRSDSRSSAMQICDRVEPWSTQGIRRAGLSAFGFGGANAHMIVEEWTGKPSAASSASPKIDFGTTEFAIVGASTLTGASRSWNEFVQVQRQPATDHDRTVTDFQLAVRHLGFPPRDLSISMPQQVGILAAVQDAISEVATLSHRTSVFIGTDVEPEISRYGLRWRFPELTSEDPERMLKIDAAWLQGLNAVLVSKLEPAGVTGTMPNIPAHRINVKHDLQGPGFTVSAGKLSGIRSLQIALRGLANHEFDAAVIGAVDLCSEPIHEYRLQSQSNSTAPSLPGDAAIAFVIKRRKDAEQAGDPILGLIRLQEAENVTESRQVTSDKVSARFGDCGAAAGLLEVAVECALLQSGSINHATISFHPQGVPAVHVELISGGSSKVRPSEKEHSSEQRLVFPAHPPRLVFPPLAGATVGPNFPKAHPRIEPVPSPSAPAAPVVKPPVVEPPVVERPVIERPFQPAPPLPQSVPPSRESVPMSGQSNVVSLHAQYLEELTRSHQMFLAGRANVLRGIQAQNQGTSPRVLPPSARTIHIRDAVLPVPPAPAVPALVPPIARVAPPATTITVPPAAVSPAVIAPPPPVAPAKPATSRPPESTKPAVSRRAPRGPSFSREQLEVLAGGKISEVFGPLFEQQDGFTRQVRMPMPPLLLADRVTGIDAEPGKSGVGTIWTETDVTWDSWYLHQGTMPAGLMIESGQADLLLISWMGADFLNRDQRVYRLLGCEATFYGSLPKPGETMCYEISIDGHARQGDIRLFFFHYDCHVNGELRLKVRHGQAGFFSNEELDNSDGVLWSPEVRELIDSRVDAPAVTCEYSQFGPAQLKDFYEGNILSCFGRGFERADTHNRTPLIGGPELNFIDVIHAFDPAGGPWKRGYLKAERTIRPDDWYFTGHFLNDPCMPGTLMLEACLQAMSFYLTGLGLTLPRDGWKFEPVPDSAVSMQCRGQVTPKSKSLVIELFIEEVHSGPDPIVFADLLCTVDGMKAFYAKRMGLRLVPSWPITSNPMVIDAAADATAVARGGVRGDYEAFLNCAWGRPSVAFGPDYIPFDTYRRTPRLPSPPYHFISRATRIDADPGNVKPGAEVEVEYDVPHDVWYFDQTPQPTMPLSVLMEALLQPCGWLAMMSGVVLRAKQELYFRNLDGKCTVYADITPDTGALRTKVRLIRASTVGETTIMFFEMTCTAGTKPIAKCETSFGFFTTAALAQQVGVTVQDDERTRITALKAATPAPDSVGVVKVPMLEMTDQVLEYSTNAGRNKAGHICAVQIVDPKAWYFKAHFYQDPVQPGSLGVQALLNLLQEWLRRSVGDQFQNPHYQPVAPDEEMVWTYRGQVVPTAQRVHQCVDIIELKRDDHGITVIAEGTLWADGLAIYRLPRFAVRITEGQASATSTPSAQQAFERTLNITSEPWWKDHCPTHAVPTMPLMGIANEIAQAAQRVWPAGKVVGIRQLNLENWLTCASPTTLKFESQIVAGRPKSGNCQVQVNMRAVSSAGGSEKSVAMGIVTLADQYPQGAALTPSTDGLELLPDSYADASLFHGPAFQLARRIWSGTGRSVSEIMIDACSIPAGAIHPGLLDAALHGIPHANWSRWCESTKPGLAGFPVQLERIEFFGPAPANGKIVAEATLQEVHAAATQFSILVRIVVDGTVWCEFVLREKLFPMGAFAGTPLVALKTFMGQKAFVPGVSLSKRDGEVTSLTVAAVNSVNWLPGTLEQVYGVTGTAADLAWQIAVREHMAFLWQVHPSQLEWDEATSSVKLPGNPVCTQRVEITREPGSVKVRNN